MTTRILISLVRLLGILPLPVIQLLGSSIGRVLFWIPNREARTVEVNLGLCFPELDDSVRKKMRAEILRENATTLLEMPSAWLQPPERWIKRIDAGQSVKDMQALLGEGKGLIVAAPHQGSWEVGVHLLSSLGPMTILYRPPRQTGVETLIVAGRAKMGARLVPTTRQGIKSLYQALERGEIVTILPDQQPKREGGGAVFAPFFGVPALTMTLVNRLARKTGAPVYFPFATRTGQGVYQAYGVQANNEIAAADPVVAATELNRCVEACVRVCPTQYLWSYRRFAAQPGGARSPYKRT